MPRRPWRRSEADFAEEIHAHVSIETDRLIAEGLSPDEARTEAMRAFGNLTQVRERFRESRRVRWFDDLRRDTVFALRAFVRNRSSNVAAMVTLGLGIGANVALFSVIQAVLLAPSPFPDMDRLALIWQTDRTAGTTREPASIPDYVDFTSTATTFQSVAAFAGEDLNVTPAAGRDPFRLAALLVTHQFLPQLGVQPVTAVSSIPPTTNLVPRQSC